MLTDERVEDAATCAARVRAVKALLYGPALGNNYSSEMRLLVARDADGLKKRARVTQAAIFDCVFDDHTTAPFKVALMTRQKEHAAIIFLAFDLANTSLLNPRVAGDDSHLRIIEDVTRMSDSPGGLILRCVEWLTN